MTINSLVNFGVPGIDQARAAPLQPIMRNKFRILFKHFGKPDAETYMVTQQVRNVSLPDICFHGPADHIRIRFLDDIANNVMSRVLEQCARQRDNNIVDTYFEMRIELLAGGPGPEVLRTYEFTNCSIHNVRSDYLNYEHAEGLEFSISVAHGFLHIYDAEMKRLW